MIYTTFSFLFVKVFAIPGQCIPLTPELCQIVDSSSQQFFTIFKLEDLAGQRKTGVHILRHKEISHNVLLQYSSA